MFDLLTEIGKFLAVDAKNVDSVKYYQDDFSKLKIVLKSGCEFLLNIKCVG